MIRVFAPASAYVVSMFLVLALGPLGGAGTLLTAGVPVGAGVAVATVCGGGYLVRGIWLVAGVMLGALGYVAGALLMPDTPLGLAIGGSIPVVLLALMTFWTRRQSHFVAGLLGVGALAGVYAARFDADPQGLNTSLPIALGQTLLPIGVGYAMGVLAALLSTDDESYFAARAARKQQRSLAKEPAVVDMEPAAEEAATGSES